MLFDTSGLLAILDRREPFHEKAHQLLDTARNQLTHNYVLLELVALAQSRGVPRAITLAYCEAVAHDVETVWVDPVLHERGMALLRARPDKRYSLCDAVSFVLMRDREITDALTTDHHFAQEGFVPLLK